MSRADNAKSTVTPLLAAVGARDESRVRQLLEAGAAPDDPAASRSPLIQAITSFDPERSAALACNRNIVRALLENGADPNRADPRIGALPLQTAFDVGDEECARIIHAAGGRIDARESSGRSVLEAAVGSAARKGGTALLDLVVSWGIDLNERGAEGSNALHEAVRVDSSEVTKFLLARGVDPCIRNSLGQTPLEMARDLDRSGALIEVLRQATRCNGNRQDG